MENEKGGNISRREILFWRRKGKTGQFSEKETIFWQRRRKTEKERRKIFGGEKKSEEKENICRRQVLFF